VNAEKLERYPSIPEKDRGLAEDVLFVRGDGANPPTTERMRSATAAFTAHFRERKPARSAAAEKLGLDERLARYVVEGNEGRPGRRPWTKRLKTAESPSTSSTAP